MSKYRDVFDAVTADPRYLANLDWGKARPGHPEGTVRAHIAELERNLKALTKLSDDEHWKLQLLIHTHDTFKGESRPGARITHSRSHASLAREFLAEFCDDPDLLAMVQYHDEPFALYRQSLHKGFYSSERLVALVETIGDWDLFLAFLIIDGCTAGKSRDPLHWFFNEIVDKVESRFGPADILHFSFDVLN